VDVGQLVARSARRYADRVAVDGPDRTLTFGELGDRVARVANGLRGLGLQPGDRVLDLQTNSTTYLETDLAIRAAGLVRVALNHRLHPTDWARIADDSGAVALVYDARFAEPASDLLHGFGEARLVVVGDAPGTPYDRLVASSPARAAATHRRRRCSAACTTPPVRRATRRARSARTATGSPASSTDARRHRHAARAR
jgi:acyl-CoA synthetase (AMP-forming)/AMP-acid ligase II